MILSIFRIFCQSTICILIGFIPIFSFADWSKQCLDDCFSTGHECNYCSYQCQAEPKPAPAYSKEIETCPLYDYQKVY